MLGPLLFLLYINDLPENIQLQVCLFADDAAVYLLLIMRQTLTYCNKTLTPYKHGNACHGIWILIQVSVRSYTLLSPGIQLCTYTRSMGRHLKPLTTSHTFTWISAKTSAGIHIWGQSHKLRDLTLKFLVKVSFYFSVMKTTWADSWSDFGHPCDIHLWVVKWRSAWPLFHGPVILPYILKTVWCMNIILLDYESV